LRKKLSETQEQLELGLEKSQKAEEDATEKAEQVTLNIIKIPIPTVNSLLGRVILGNIK